MINIEPRFKYFPADADTVFPVWVFLCTQPPSLPACSVCRPLSAALSSSVQALPALAQVQSLRRVNERLLAENRAMLRVLARLSDSASMPETEDLWSSDCSSSFLPLLSASLHTPLSSWCLHSPLCCVPVRQVLHPPVASSHWVSPSHTTACMAFWGQPCWALPLKLSHNPLKNCVVFFVFVFFFCTQVLNGTWLNLFFGTFRYIYSPWWFCKMKSA